MLCNRLKQFREYNGLEAELLAQILEISAEEYEAFETGKEMPTIDIIERLAKCYKVTVNEFYGYTPRLSVLDKNMEQPDNDINEKTLKMSDLSWDEAQLILYYRNTEDKDDLISEIIRRNKDKNGV